MKIKLFLIGLIVFSFIVGLWPGVEGQHGGLGVGVEGQRGAAEHIQSLSIFNVWAQFRPRPEAESLIRGPVPSYSIWLDSLHVHKALCKTGYTF